MLKWILSYSILCIVYSAYGQRHSMYQYTIADGLPSNYVYGVLEDNDGYIWAYTEGGVAKFDGYHWKPYTQKQGLPGNDVYEMVIDGDGVIWGQTFNHKPFNIISNKIKSKDSEIVSGKLILNKDDKVLFGQHGDRIFYDDSLNSKTIESSFEGTLEYPIARVNDSIYFEANFENGFSLKKFVNDKNDYSFYTDEYLEEKYNHFYSPKTNTYYITSQNKICIIDIRGSNHREIPLATYNLNPKKYTHLDIYIDNILITTDVGAVKMDHSHNVETVFIDNDFSEKYDQSRVFWDTNDNIWIGTRSSGLFLLPKNHQRTEIITKGNPNENAYEGIDILDNGNIYISNDYGQVSLIKNKTLRKVYNRTNLGRYYGSSQDPDGVTFHAHHKVGTMSIQETSIISDFISQYPFSKIPSISQSSFETKAMFQNFKNSVTVTPNQIQYSNNAAFISNRSYIYRVLGSKAELICYFPRVPFRGKNPYYTISKKAIVKFTHNNKEKINLPNKYIYTDVLPLDDGNYLLGTQDNGLLKFDPLNNSTTNILKSKYVKRVKKIDTFILAATYSGTYVLNEDLEILDHLDITDGLPTNEVNDAIYYDGDVYSATSSGLAITKLEHEEESKNDNAKYKVSEIYVNGIQRENLNKLTTKTNSISIHHPLRDYASNKNIKYEYRLLPKNKDWNVSISPSTTFYNLEAGEYEFELRARDISDNVYEAPILEFQIPSPLYKRSWFLIGTFLLSLLAIFNYQKRREKRRELDFKKESEITAKMADLQLTALRSQMNPHFVFNALGAIQYYIQTAKTNEADEYLTHFALLLRKYIDNSEKNTISVSEEAKLLNLYLSLEKMRFEDVFSYEVSIDSKIDQLKSFLPSMLIQPFVENAVNHGLPKRTDGKAHIQIRFDKIDENIVIFISDNGLGENDNIGTTDKSHKSKGMAVLEEKLKTLNDSGIADVTISSEPTNKESQFPGITTTIIIKKHR